VRREVVHAVDRLAEPHRQRLGGSHPDEQRSGETRPVRDGDGVHVVQRDAGLLTGALDGRHHRLEVRPGRHLRHHPSEAGVLVHARRDRVREQGAAADQTDAGLVARGLDAEYQRAHRRSMTTASEPSR
jgi:hypothetical protein